MVQPERIRILNSKPQRQGAYVLYWMQSAQRAEWNHALEFAAEEANRLRRPLVACFGLTDSFPEANLRHLAFMVEGLEETARALRARGVALVVERGSPEAPALRLADGASLVVADRGYLRCQRQWRERLAREAPCQVVQVETDVVVPIEAVSGKEEYAAATLRPRLRKVLDRFLVALDPTPLAMDSLGLRLGGERVDKLASILKTMRVDRSVSPSARFHGGPSEARRWLARFVETRLDDYAGRRGDPGADVESHLSPYLHFGHISPLEVALTVKAAARRKAASRESFLEELVVRRELSANFVYFNASYDTYACLPEWARRTLEEHAGDRREYVYSAADLEQARTHDPYWNAAQREMTATGKMQNYMRMYWGKKILEWSATPQEAFETALALNNKFELDGRDPNAFAGVAWCFGKHDRPWIERRVFGKTRYMNANGLRRKFDMDGYLARVEAMCAAGGERA